MKRGLWLVGALVALTACGSSAATSATTVVSASSTTAATVTTSTVTTITTGPPIAAFPVTIGTVTIAAKPSRVISLSPTATEMLFAMGAGPQVVAVDALSDFPAGAPKTDLSGFNPNVEAIAAKNPDLVVVSNDTNNVVAGLGALKIAVLVEPAAVTIDNSYHQIDELGRATGNTAPAAAEVSTMKQQFADLAGQLAPHKGMRYYHELDNTYYTATSKTFIGAVYALAGLENIGDAADTGGTGYPQLSAEYIVNANPDVVFLADTVCCGQNASTVTAREGWSQIAAVRKGLVIGLDDSIASRWGPRTPQLLEAIIAAFKKAGI
jgi:iron complex transport system substrate-binding protein